MTILSTKPETVAIKVDFRRLYIKSGGYTVSWVYSPGTPGIGTMTWVRGPPRDEPDVIQNETIKSYDC